MGPIPKVSFYDEKGALMGTADLSGIQLGVSSLPSARATLSRGRLAKVVLEHRRGTYPYPVTPPMQIRPGQKVVAIFDILDRIIRVELLGDSPEETWLDRDPLF
jgi:hypothetical protein